MFDLCHLWAKFNVFLYESQRNIEVLVKKLQYEIFFYLHYQKIKIQIQTLGHWNAHFFFYNTCPLILDRKKEESWSQQTFLSVQSYNANIPVPGI